MLLIGILKNNIIVYTKWVKKDSTLLMLKNIVVLIQED